MKRRHVLGTAALLLLSGGLPALLGAAKAAVAKRVRAMRRVRPSDPSWPDASRWAKLKEAVGGNLTEVHPLFGPCGADAKGAACTDALKYIKNPYWLGDQAGGTQISGWVGAWTPAPSAYAIKARNAADVAAGVNFARDNNLRLVVKGGGHSYLGTSNAPDSLLIWTRALNKVTLHEAFVGQGCAGRIAPVPAVSAGAGAVWMDLYHAVTVEAGRYVQGGGCMTVGVAGLVLGGGFGTYSRRFGTAAAGLLEAEIVTADGQIRVINECSDPDLFWAIKGGGGGTFGIVTRLTLRTHELPQYFGGAGGKIKAQSDGAFRQLIAQFTDLYRNKLMNSHWGETVHWSPDNTVEISMSCQGLDPTEVTEIWSPFFDWVKARPNDFAIVSPLGAGAGDSRRAWDSTQPWFAHDTREGAPAYHAWNKGNEGECGALLYGYDSLWLSARLLQEDRRKDLNEALFAASRHAMVRFHTGKALAGAPPEVLAAVRQTSTHPAVLDAFTLVIIADGDETPAYPGMARPPVDLARARKGAHDIDLAMADLRKVAPHAGSYVNEGNYFNPVWQEDFWGENYSRLRAIKAKFDPDGLFFVHHGVGSEDWSADGFTRQASPT